MNWISQAKADLRDLLATDGFKALAFNPPSLNDKQAVIEADSPYITNGLTFGEYQLNLTVVLTFKVSSNKTMTEQTDDALVRFFDLVEPEGWAVTDVEVGMVDDNSNTYASAVISINNTFVKD